VARYGIKQKALAAADDFSITDEEGKVAYRVKGKAVRLVDELKLCGPGGKELLRLRQKALAAGFTYRFLRGDEEVAVLRKKVLSFRPRYELEVAGGEPVRITGSLRQFEWDFESEGALVARVGKKLWAVADTYGVEVADGADVELVLAAVIAIDAIARQERQANAARAGRPPGSARR
jgi:uncharacterized protein YxjI